ncbi:MAG: N-6 DNA methylase, partial [Thermodesulfobacteriota bacterium]|nr:N-6 DNA methylase [Thermodesulfobacteriota bacterium]
MKRKTKLTEKGTRVSDIRQDRWENPVKQYLEDVEPLHSESARSHRFGMLAQELLSVEPGFIENYVSGIEQYIKVQQKDRLLRGRADNLFGSIIIEFEANIPKKLGEAEEQLRRYAAILWSQEPVQDRLPYLCLATDGVRFVVYTPIQADPAAQDVAPDDINLQVLEETDWNKLRPHEVFYWLDRYFLRREILSPTSETIVHDFGLKSHAFQATAHLLLVSWQELKDQSAFAVVFESWEKYLRLVYGNDVADDELFVRHTYLATLAKLMSWMRLSGRLTLPGEAQIIEMLSGRLFKRQGLENFIEEDFFSWIGRGEAAKAGVGAARWLFSLLQKYNLRELSEDVLKSLYQELIDPETRHDLGEFYTPDWLAHRIIRKLLNEKPEGSILDPACGSGTFLYLAIREKRRRLGNSTKTLHHILDSVYGADVHPLAVIVAKTNFVLALGDLLNKREGAITIPVYLADTLKLPEKIVKLTKHDVYEIKVDSETLWVHGELLADLSLYDQAIELAKDFAHQNKGRQITRKGFDSFLETHHFPQRKNEPLVNSLFQVADSLKSFIDADRDTIWAFVLKNMYKPLFFKDKFDFIVGNPPWITFRFLEPNYQRFLKGQITRDYKLIQGRGELITHLEVATLFFVRTADLYLKKGGIISFILPRSLFSADQHHDFRRRAFQFYEDSGKNLSWREIWDCENVELLFNVPACVLTAEKNVEEPAGLPIPGQVISGKLLRKNASLAESEQALSVEDIELHLHIRAGRSFWATEKGTEVHEESYYKSRFFQGATIVPRSFWFVEVETSPVGINPNLPLLRTDPRATAHAKNPYRDIKMRGNVENRFLYAALLSTDLLPFGHLDYRLAVLPIEPQEKNYRLLNADQARENGFLYLAQWLEEAEEEWARLRGSKAQQMNIYERLDRVHGLTRQNPVAPYWVLYNRSGTYLTAAVMKNRALEFDINGQMVMAQGFIFDTTIYYSAIAHPHEAFYLTAVFNSPILNELVKPMQSRGLWGPRDIAKKVLDFPIPQFEPKNSTHRRLAALGRECGVKVEKWRAGGGPGK